jgi:hypothetical protein
MFPCSASDTPMSSDTARILNNIDERRSQRNTEDKKAADRLNKEGDKLYKRGEYTKAYDYYDNSYPNYPNAYSYIMSGDNHWRSVVQYQTHALKDKYPCQFSNEDFPHRLDMSLSQTYEVGIALAVKDKDAKILKTDLYKRAVNIDLCLRKVYDFYKKQSSDACIDAKKIQACLGKPLIK